MKKKICIDCKPDKLKRVSCKDGSSHIGMYCSKCDKWFKWVPKKELNKLAAEKLVFCNEFVLKYIETRTHNTYIFSQREL